MSKHKWVEWQREKQTPSWDHDPSHRQMLNELSHPGAPKHLQYHVGP